MLTTTLGFLFLIVDMRNTFVLRSRSERNNAPCVRVFLPAPYAAFRLVGKCGRSGS